MFIALEGIDGSGKSTQMKLLAARFADAGFKVYTTFEPTGSSIGTIIRDIMKGKMKADEKVIAGLFVADRLNHLLDEENGILQKLKEGYVVITDRYYFSSYAYHGTHMDMGWVINANAMSAEILRPDINIFIDVSPEISMQRVMQNRDEVERYETLENLQNVRRKYLEAFARLKDEETVFIVNGDRPTGLIADEIWDEISRKQKER
jgi:dTMP kinase